MGQKSVAFLLIALSLVVVSGCGDDGGAAGGKWVGEVFGSTNSKSSTRVSKSSTQVGEYDSYEECFEATQKEAKSGIFNCGVK